MMTSIRTSVQLRIWEFPSLQLSMMTSIRTSAAVLLTVSHVVLSVVVSGSSTLTPVGLLIAAICHGFAIYAAIANSYHVSGGHVNPAVTAGLLVGGYITVFKAILYIIMQLIGAALASLLLVYVTNGVSMPVHAVGGGDTVMEALVLEIVMTFILLYTIYARAVDPRAKETSSSAPLTVGLVVTALILCGGPFSSTARSFGPALVAWDWTNRVGPIVGGALAALVYELIYITSSPSHERLAPSHDY